MANTKFLQSEASVWRMGRISTKLARIRIKTLIFHMANSIAVLACQTMKKCRIICDLFQELYPTHWNWLVLKKSRMWAITSLSYPRPVLFLLCTIICSHDMMIGLERKIQTFVYKYSSSLSFTSNMVPLIFYVLLMWWRIV